MNQIFENHYNNLNINQKKAVDCLDGPVLVVAGPGSGKTELLSIRVANILAKTDTNADNILCLTFTESAAINMRQRLFALIGQDAYKIAIHTFHSFGVEIINRYPEYFYKGANFTPADPLSQLELLENIFKDLSFDNPLNSYHPEQGYVYLYDVENAISLLKKAGISPDEFNNILCHNEKLLTQIKEKIDSIFSERLSIKIFPKIEELLKDLKTINYESFPIKHFKPLLPIIVNSLSLALNKSIEVNKTIYLREWKNKVLKKDNNGHIVLKEQYYNKHLKALGEIYKKYTETMNDNSLLDFQDMILQVINALENNQSLLYEIQEQYLYYLVDEFQDTNDAQMRLINLLTSAKEYEGRPNIMVVGDDDQAIYKFQGADLSNILNFKDNYKEPTIITLQDNYRSSQDILNVARDIIIKGEERLENIVNSIDKKLKASNAHIKNGDINYALLNTQKHEYFWITQKIKEIVEKNNFKYSDTAIISRKHSQLEEIAPFLHKENIPINYERQQNILHEPHIKQIVQIAKFIDSLSHKDVEYKDNLLPEILSYPFWAIPREDIWQISKKSKDNYQKWFDCMLESDNKLIKNIALFFRDLSVLSFTEPLEQILNIIISGENDEKIKNKIDKSYTFKNYYFNTETFTNKKEKYLDFLSSLQTLFTTIREYKKKKNLLLSDFITFIEIHEKNNIPIMAYLPYSNSDNAVNLLTAHKAKGLEYEVVFVLSCNNHIWANKRAIANKLHIPINLPIKPAGDNLDDQLRLFFVAITRAKRFLYLSAFKNDEKGNEKYILSFLNIDNFTAIDLHEDNNENKIDLELDIVKTLWDDFYKKPIKNQENAVLRLLLENYQMSVTHLNNFLDVTKNGPQVFLEQNLLRFPQPKLPAGAYGTAIHKAIQLLYINFKKNNKLPGLEYIIKIFEQSLLEQRLNEADYNFYLQKGRHSLHYFYNHNKDKFNLDDQIEFDFKNQGVVLNDAKITGKIDKLVKISNDELSVHDFKSGKIKSSWQGKTKLDKITLLNYKRQLVFYKLLVENSRTFSKKYKVNVGVLEFITPNENNEIVNLKLDITNDDVDRLKELIQKVYSKIINLDFVNVEHYTDDVKGIIDFEDDLLNDKI